MCFGLSALCKYTFNYLDIKMFRYILLQFFTNERVLLAASFCVFFVSRTRATVSKK